jgi:hypothetical protein
VGLFLLSQVVLMLGVATYFGGKSIYLTLEGETAEATVVDMRRTSKGGATPIVEFTTSRGQRIRHEGDVSSRPPAHELGEKVTVHYLPSRPNVAVIGTFLEMWFLPVTLALFGAGGLVAGVGLTVLGFRRKKARDRTKTTGLHLVASVIGAKAVRMKRSTHYEPIVEARNPRTGTAIQCTGDRQPSEPAIGSRAVVHVEPAPPHRYFVEMG